MKWYLKCLKNYFVFQGRARRKEYWMFALVNFLITAMFQAAAYLTEVRYLGDFYTYAVFIPSVAVLVRRLHDTGRSGWWAFAYLVSLMGSAIFVLFSSTLFFGASEWLEYVYLFCSLIFLALVVFCFVLLCKEGTKGDNQYGPDPKAVDAY